MKFKRISILLLTVAAALILSATAGARGVHSARLGSAVTPPVFSPAEVAPEEACPNQTSLALSAEEQASVVLCMTNYARAVNGLAPLKANTQLGRAAAQKSIDVLGCGEFSHYACGRNFFFWDQKFGYLKGCWKVGENIAWGTGPFATVRSIVPLARIDRAPRKHPRPVQGSRHRLAGRQARRLRRRRGLDPGLRQPSVLSAADSGPPTDEERRLRMAACPPSMSPTGPASSPPS